MFKCKECDKEFETAVKLGGHIAGMIRIGKHKKLETFKIDNNWQNENGKYKCPYCEEKFSKKGIGTHIWRKHGKGINHNPDPNKGYKNGTKVIWNKGLTKETNGIIKNISKTRQENLKKKV